ncbi:MULTISPECIES: hypothetical protein [unclassified Nocardioides]|uniref:hypothetical protein n=1 Tax=unclassified Nocardioides TaxID=2615069 RepID=UPI00115499B8|nr:MULTISPECIES: hypothetical protein [unclassified Nocardioides]TQK69630.1 hypothetical protein FBY23_1396 [Nocardioides sp. SLBN-35]WGY01128.1 hypothetical protein QI633_21635 [Nocardioides sp. QY071]
MADTAPPGFVARNNEVIGSILSILALLVSVGMGAGLMFGTGTRGVSAILTVLTVAGGAFTLLLLGVGTVLRGATPTDQWEAEETAWRAERGLDPLTDADRAASAKAHRRAALLAVLALLVGLALSVLPDIF